MHIVQTFFDNVHLLDVPRHIDERGWFSESQHQHAYAQCLGLQEPLFWQSNISLSHQHVLRGLHAQLHQPQGKLIQVLTGQVFDVFVDIRPSSPTFGHWQSIVLTADSSQQLWLPPGYAHGFLTLASEAIVLYHCTDYYVPNDQIALHWNDSDLNIAWPLDQQPILSDKDAAGMTFKEYVKCVS